ncbi:MAG TPA: hypothetical protein PLE19_07635 [Planctomycetota bacterium]|nr:hypothetical protein [Planctomycetota bacterium]HRR78946.1 hypothetical protein [Planctomycetota bacterium]HRT92776.1 hypothetical protein [Planctomycetota bacterium]
MNRPLAVAAWAAFLCAAASPRADEKLVILDDVPRNLSLFEVAPDGSRLFFGAGSYHVFDAGGRLVDKWGIPTGAGRELVPLPNGWFVAFNSHASGHIAMFRPDGSPERTLVGRGGDEKHLRHDMTGWTSPTGGAVDPERKLLFALDTSMGQRGEPDPVWSRVAIFDFDGKYVGDIARFDGKAKDADDARRTWYDDIEVDPARQRVYVTARRTGDLLVFGYDGKPAGTAPGRGGIAVFPDGRIAVGAKDGRGVQLYDPDLKPLRVLPLQGLQDLEADASGRLYASVNDPTVTFIRWSPDLEKSETFGPRFVRISADFPNAAAKAGELLTFKVRAEGRPEPAQPGTWQVMIRPSDGSDLRWRPLPINLPQVPNLREVRLEAATPETLSGFYEVAVKFGPGPIVLADRANDLYVQRPLAFLPQGAERSIAVIASTGRRCFQQGEAIAIQVVRRGDFPADQVVRLALEKDGAALASGEAKGAAFEIPAAVTQSLPPGEYDLRPTIGSDKSCVVYPLRFVIAQAQPDSPMQRILYHEFDNEAVTMRQNNLADNAERMAFIRDYTEAVARLGFSRETDRLVGKLNTQTGPAAWRRDYSPVELRAPGYAPPEHYAFPPANANWEAEYYLDQATRWGIRYDTQLLGHCSGVRFRDEWLQELVPLLQRTARWLGKYPSFCGFNYNDEMFFGQWVTDWKQEDKDWLKAKHEGEFKGRPMADVYMHALRTMYGAFNKGVREANPKAKVTATPMWQFPAVEGSYPPVIYEDMDESYSHYLSEGYHYPWYPAHSVDAVRRPGKPLMGVFDNSYSGEGGDCYLQDLMQVLARGVQGAGVQHTRPFRDARGASAYRVGNFIAKVYGPVFAECQPANEAAVLYSYTQDVTERRNSMGTPHWERVFALHTAGLMAGVPMFVTFEEDVAAGWLLEDSGKMITGKMIEERNRKAGMPRVPMLFLVGQTKPLPPKVQEQIGKFIEAGGKVFTDADSADYPGATTLALKTHELKSLWHEGYAADTIYPLFAPVQEKLAAELRAAVGQFRRFPVDSDNPWVAVNQFDGGAVRYLMVTTDEGTPYPWDAGTVWSLGATWRFSVLPKTATITFPDTGGVVYDVFEHTLVKPQREGGKRRLTVDLRTFPGRLYALAPEPLSMAGTVLSDPGATAALRHCMLRAVDRRGTQVGARVPLRLRLRSQTACALEICRATGASGDFRHDLHVPTGDGWSLEATELLGGSSVALPLGAGPRLADLSSLAASEVASNQQPMPAPEAPQRLSQFVGARLDAVKVAADGRHLLVTAKGYLKNVALVEDRGGRARVERAVRVGQAPTVGATCLAPDGSWFAASARMAARFGQGLQLIEGGKATTFAAFGDEGRMNHRFAVSPDGDTVLAPGKYGVVCWRRHRSGPFWNRRAEWKEAWSLDYWKEFPKLDWPVHETKERIPQFHAFIPASTSRGSPDPREVKSGGHALILFGEFSNQGWVTPDNPCSAWLAAVSLDDGKELWRFDVPIFKTLLFPTLHTSPDGTRLLLQVQMGSWGRETFRFFAIDGGVVGGTSPSRATRRGDTPPTTAKLVASWDSKIAPLDVAVADATGNFALVFNERLVEMRRPDGSLVYNFFWKNQPVGVAFAADGQRLYIADDAGRLTQLDAAGHAIWHADLGCVSALAASGERVYAAGWDGRLRAFDGDGEPAWMLDLTPAMLDDDPMAAVAVGATSVSREERGAETPRLQGKAAVQAVRPSTVSNDVPQGENLLRTGKATLTLGGTKSWMSEGKLQVKAEELTNGQTDDVATPWLHLDELFWDATAGRQVWAEIEFKQPTDVRALTIYENSAFPDSWPTEGLVQVWDEGLKRWNTATFGVFLTGPVNTYALNLKGVSKLRYVPWGSYYRNFHTSEIEVR